RCRSDGGAPQARPSRDAGAAPEAGVTRAQVQRLVDVFLANQEHGLPVALEAVASVAVSMHGDRGDTRTPVTKESVRDARLFIAEVARHRGVTVERLLSGCKRKEVVACRWECFARLLSLRFSSVAVGRLMRRHHSTVLHGVKRFEMEQPALAAQLRGGDELAARRAVAA
ncbi:MAG: hypothetical protein ABUR63_00385, partial [Verrucomicrobiota bacterium]